MNTGRSLLKAAMGRLPLVPELYQRRVADGAEPTGGYRLPQLEAHLPGWVRAVEAAADGREGARRILVFGYLPWWLEHAVALGLLLRWRGHSVDLAYLPARRWHADASRFDLRRQAAYLADLLRPLRGVMRVLDLDQSRDRLAPPLRASIDQQSRLDVQYTLQREDIAWETDRHAQSLLRLRTRRNLRLASGALRVLRQRPYDTIVIPNGSILEFGALYRTARHLGLRTVTYEFGEQRQHLWLAQEAEVMRLPTDELWAARGAAPLVESELARLDGLYAARRHGRKLGRFGRSWQSGISQGAAAARQRLGLDPDRPIALLCTNVVGDSLALDRQVFTDGMAEWLAATARSFAQSGTAQLVVRVHPGEMLGAGHPSVDILRQALPQLPPQVTVVPPESDVNTYDLIELAHLGLVYTTTVGMEMAMFGLPAVVSGATHYRGRGFTDDPTSLGEYLDTLARRMQEPAGRRLPDEQIDLAWRYAYRFFFEFPFAFPWHLLSFWEDLAERPLESVVSREPPPELERTLEALAGQPVDWSRVPQAAEVPA